MKLLTGVFAGVALCQLAAAAEVTVQNDSLTNFGTAVIVAGFIPGEKGASWLTSPCEGNIVAVQILWLSSPGGAPDVLGDSIDIYRAGTYPNPGALAQEIVAPLLTEGVINEYRYLDDDSTVPLIVPVAANETFVVAYQFSETAVAGGPSLVRDTNGITAGRNAIYANLGGSNFAWFSSEGLGVTGDWVIRAVIDCPTGGTQADVHSAISTTPDLYVPGAAISHEITVGNSGPGNASSVIVVDTFPASYTGVTWSCAASGGATCTSAGSPFAGEAALAHPREQAYARLIPTPRAGVPWDVLDAIRDQLAGHADPNPPVAPPDAPDPAVYWYRPETSAFFDELGTLLEPAKHSEPQSGVLRDGAPRPFAELRQVPRD